MGYPVEFALAGIAGVLTHLALFQHGEYHLRAPTIARVYLWLLLAILCIQLKFFDLHFQDAVVATLSISAFYGVSFFTSLTTYRLLFHRLRSFPGPILAKVTKFYHMWNVRDYDQYLFLHRLHCQYGDYVRTGPNEVTIFSPEAIPKVLGPASKSSKSPWWEMMWPQVSMATTRSKSNHDSRRRAWDMGFSSSGTARPRNSVVGHFGLGTDAVGI